MKVMNYLSIAWDILRDDVVMTALIAGGLLVIAVLTTAVYAVQHFLN